MKIQLLKQIAELSLICSNSDQKKIFAFRQILSTEKLAEPNKYLDTSIVTE